MTGAAKAGIGLLITLVFLMIALVVPSVQCALRANVVGMSMLGTVEAQLATTTYADFWRQQAPLLTSKSSWSDESPCPGLPSLVQEISCALQNGTSTGDRLPATLALTAGWVLHENGLYEQGVQTWREAGISRDTVILTIAPGIEINSTFQRLVRDTTGLPIVDNQHRLRLAYFLEARGELDESAQLQTDAAHSMEDISADFWMATGEAARLRHNWEQAAIAYQRAWQLSPTTTIYYQRETNAWALDGQWDKAEQAAERWRMASTDSYDALVVSARIALEQRAYVEAEGFLATAIERDATRGTAYFLLGRLKYALNQRLEALTYLEQALNREPGLQDAASLRAIILAEMAK